MQDEAGSQANPDYVGDAVIAIDALGKLWQAVTNDSQQIALWLKDGADDAVSPSPAPCSAAEK